MTPLALLDALQDRPVAPGELVVCKCVQHKNIIANFVAQQEPLGDEFNKVLDENRWDLYEAT